jgi:ADP-ribose pyrophosphatase YjhB (NUDIX family)
MPNREYPELPMVGVGGVVISGNRVLLARRGAEPLRGEWSIPGGLLEVGETIEQGVARELLEETGLVVRVGELIEALERIFFDPQGPAPEGARGVTPEGAQRVAPERTPGVDPVRPPQIAPEGASSFDPSLAPGRDLERTSAFGAGEKLGGVAPGGAWGVDPARARDVAAEGTPAPRIARRENIASPAGAAGKRPKYHYVILDYLCEVAEEAAAAKPRAGGDVTEVAFAREDQLPAYRLNPKTLEVIAKAFAMSRARP